MELESLTRPPGSKKHSTMMVRNEFRLAIAPATALLESYYSTSNFVASEKRALSAELIRIKTAIDAVLKLLDVEIPDSNDIQTALDDLKTAWSNFKSRTASFLKTRESKPQFPEELAKAQSIIHDSAKMVKRFLKGPRSPRVKVTRDAPSPPPTEIPSPRRIRDDPEKEMSKDEEEQCLKKIAQLKTEILASQNRNREAQKKLRRLTKDSVKPKSDIRGDVDDEYRSLLERQKAELITKTKEINESIENTCLAIDETERDVEAQIAKFEQNVEQLRHQHELYCREVLGTKQQKSALDRQYFDLCDQIQKMNEEKREIRRKVHERKQELEQMQAEQEDIDAIMGQWRKELKELNAQSSGLEAEIAELKAKRSKGSDLDRAYDKCDDVEEDVYKLRQRHRELRKVIIPDLKFKISRVSAEVGHLAVLQQKGDSGLKVMEMNAITKRIAEMYPQ